MLDKDAFEAFRESGDLFDRRIAADFRRKVLARGGEQDGMSLYRAFRGKDPDKWAMLRSRGLWIGPDPADSLAAAESPAPGFRHGFRSRRAGTCRMRGRSLLRPSPARRL